MPIKAVFFDLYNTLAGFNPPREVIQARAAAKFGLALEKAGVDAGYAIADAFMARQNAGPTPVRTMTATERDGFFARYEQMVLSGAGHQVTKETAGLVWKEVVTQQYALALFEDVAPTLKQLREAGYKLGVITNLNSTGEEVLTRFGLREFADFAVSSRDAGAEKPHAPIFLAALARAGCQPAEAAHVGDQLDADIAGARAVGIHAVLMDRYNTQPDYVATPRVTGMAVLPDVLATLS